MRRPTQPEFVDFYLPFDGKLRAENRWVKLAGFVPWELVEDRYAGALAGTGMGAPALPGRVAFGALVIKERLGITDEETVAQVLENPYLQHFLGFREMLEEAPFDASMMVHFRARFGQLDYEEINGAIIRMACGDDDSATPEPEAEEAPANCGKLLIDASCPPADITYRLRAAKRASRIGWRDEEGERTNVKHLRWADGHIGWREIAASEAADEQHNRQADSRAISNAAEGKLDGLELELSQEIANSTGRPAAGFYIPNGALVEKRDMNVGTSSEGGYLSDQVNLQFIDRLANKALVVQMGATVMSGLNGSPSFPRMDTGSTAYWVAESGQVTESTPAIGQVNLNRKTISADTEFTKELLVESAHAVDSIIRNELTRTIALGIDAAAIAGTGSSNQPLGIVNQSGVAVVEADVTDGADMTWLDTVNLLKEIKTSNGDTGTIGILTNADLEAKLMTTEKVASTGLFIWEDGDGEFGRVAGRRAGVSNAVPNDGAKGSGTNLSTIIAGVWSELIVGYWGSGLDVVVDPYSKRTTRIVGVTASNFCDVAVRHPASFAKLEDAVTA